MLQAASNAADASAVEMLKYACAARQNGAHHKSALHPAPQQDCTVVPADIAAVGISVSQAGTVESAAAVVLSNSAFITAYVLVQQLHGLQYCTCWEAARVHLLASTTTAS